MRDGAIPLRDLRSSRPPLWWAGPALTALALGFFAAYVGWAVFRGDGYYAAPYLSPLYSPCLSANCASASATLLGAGWRFSPAILVVWIPLGLRVTCYYYRKAYYRAVFLSPPACGVPGGTGEYSGESRLPLLLQNLHRYFFYLSIPVLAFIWWDAVRAFRFGDSVGIGLGSLILAANAVLLSLYAASCHTCRHLCGGHLKSLGKAPLRHRLWKYASRLNRLHGEYGWVSLAWVAFADFYVHLLALGAIADFRFF